MERVHRLEKNITELVNRYPSFLEMKNTKKNKLKKYMLFTSDVIKTVSSK